MKNIIVLKQNKYGTKSYHLSDNKLRIKLITMVTSAFVAVLMIGLSAGYLIFNKAPTVNSDILKIQSVVDQKETELYEFKSNVNRELDALSIQIGGLYAQSLRINALGSRVSEVANLDASEFDFSLEPGIGGADLELMGKENTSDDLFQQLYSIKSNFEHQEQQLSMLNQLLDEKNSDEKVKPSGKPIRKGWMSSKYGSRVDPFTGQQAFHSGLDFSGKIGSVIQSLADGVVIWAGKRGNYGNLVEVDHGSGYITRYAHLSKINVSVGDKVIKQQEIGIMGKTGRATSEHLHFEILKNGKKLNPWAFVANK
jgi:murein DD-endopeptidase MepM/ murein hydrolase activator NlpD